MQYQPHRCAPSASALLSSVTPLSFLLAGTISVRLMGLLPSPPPDLRANFLHGRNLREMADLHRQLARSLATVQLKQLRATLRQKPPHKGEQQPQGGGGCSDNPSELASALVAAAAAAGGKDGGGSGEALLSAVSDRPLPSSRVLGCLRRALAAGWADQVSGTLGFRGLGFRSVVHIVLNIRCSIRLLSAEPDHCADLMPIRCGSGPDPGPVRSLPFTIPLTRQSPLPPSQPGCSPCA